MGEVNLDINGRRFQVACEDGQEDHVRALGAYLAEKVQAIAEQVGQVGEPRLLVMAGLLIADELHDARSGLSGSAASATRDAGGSASETEVAAAELLDRTAEKLERIAERLEAS